MVLQERHRGSDTAIGNEIVRVDDHHIIARRPVDAFVIARVRSEVFVADDDFDTTIIGMQAALRLRRYRRSMRCR